MKKRNSIIARILAALALIAAVAAIVVVVNGATTSDSESDSTSGKTQTTTAKKKQQQKPKSTAKTYTVEEGDTLTAISEKTGVSVAELRELNPGVDPQILSVGDKLKLR